MQATDVPFGLDDGDWAVAKAELREAILRAAREGRVTTYSEVAPQVTVAHVELHSAVLNHLLGAILRDEHAAGRPLLTALVTHKDGDKEPGAGFYEMAKSLGYRFASPVEFWATQVQAVFEVHRRS